MKSKMIEVKVNKERFERRLAKAIWLAIRASIAASVVFLIASISAMIQAWEIGSNQLTIAVISACWLAAMSIFIETIKRDKR